MVQREGARTCTDRDHKNRADFCSADVQDVLHDALRVSDSTRNIDRVENESKAKLLSMAISGISLAGRSDYAASSAAFYAVIRCNLLFIRSG